MRCTLLHAHVTAHELVLYFGCDKIFPEEYDLMLRTLVSPAARVIMLASNILEGKQMTLTEY